MRIALSLSVLVLTLFLPGHAFAQGDTWATKALLPTARRVLALAEADGKIYAVGGGQNDFASGYLVALGTNEVFNPATNSWAVGSPMPTARHSLAAVGLNGKVYTLGGTTTQGSTVATVEVYDPAVNSWSTAAPMPTARRSLGAAVVNGKIYAIGGVGTSVVEEFDPSTNSWVTKAPMPTARGAFAIAVDSGKIYAIGGTTNVNDQLAVVEVFNPATNTWSTVAPLPSARQGAVGAAVYGKVYAIGGFVVCCVPLSNVDEFDPAANTWTARSAMPTARDQMGSAAPVVNGAIYVFGGADGGRNHLGKNEAYTPPPSTIPDTTAPSVPIGPTAVAASSTQINFAWSPSIDNIGVTHYLVFRGGVLRTTVNAPATSFNDTGLAASTSYSYTVSACDAAGNCSTPSASVSATTSAASDTTPPSAPTGLTAIAASSSQINLSWNASSDNVGVTQYKITRTIYNTCVPLAEVVCAAWYSATTLVATLSGTPPTTNYSDTGLSASTLYEYNVQACDAAGNCSAPSAPVSATTLPANFPVVAVFTPVLKRGWNLLGNGLNVTLVVESVFGSVSAPISGVTSHVNSVWKWNTVVGGWQFYAPGQTAAQNQAYADANGFEVLASIEPGTGYWVNIKNTAPVEGVALVPQNGTPVTYEAANPTTGARPKIAGRSLVASWNLVAIADALMPSQFNENLSGTAPQASTVKLSFQSLWAWDAAQGAWYFYAPQLEKEGVAANQGLALVKQYAERNGFLHFEDFSRKLGVGTGFWVNGAPGGSFGIYTLSITNAGTGSGSVGVSPSASTYAAGTVVTLTATPNAGYEFAGWSGACTGTAATCTLTISGNTSVTATFSPVTATTYTLVVAAAGNGLGSVTRNPSGPTYPAGTAVTLSATANPGSTFAGWSGDCSGTGSCTLTMNSNKTVTATFNLIPVTYMLTTGIAGSGNGSMNVNPSGPNYVAGTVVTVSATASSGSTFAGWSGDCSGTGSCTLTMNSNKSVTATFTLLPAIYTLTTGTSGTGTGTVSVNPAGPNYASGTVVTLTASPNAGSMFTGWSGDCTGTGTCTVTMNSNKSVTATFAPIPAGATGCPSIYDGNWIGQFAYGSQTYYDSITRVTTTVPAGAINVTLTLECLGSANGTVALAITHANVSHPAFGCQVSGCTPLFGSAATFPSDPPTTPLSPSQAGQGLAIVFPNGTALTTANGIGAMNVTSTGGTVSNSLDPSIANQTWAGIPWATYPQLPPGIAQDSFKQTGWTFSKSAF